MGAANNLIGKKNKGATAALTGGMWGGGLIAKSVAFTLKNEGRGKKGRPGELYKDTEGNPSIGIGFNLNRAGAEDTLKAAGLNYDDILAGKVTLTNKQMDGLFLADVRDAHKSAKTIFTDWDKFSDDRKIALADMVLNLGVTKFKGFSRMIGAINSDKELTGVSDWEAAAYEALTNKARTGPSLWSTQVKGRAFRVADKLRGRKEAAPSWGMMWGEVFGE